MAFQSLRRGFSKVNDSIVAGLDIGASKVCCAIARIESSGDLSIIGYGFHPSKGIRGGMIIDMESLQDSVAHAVHSAEEMSRETINDVYVSVSPAICTSKIVGIDLSISGHPVDDNDIKKIVQQSLSSINKNQAVVIHSIPLNYEIDGVSGIKDPRGMFGEILKSKINLMLCSHTPLRNLSACVERSHLDVAGFVSSIYSSGLSTLVHDELELGVTLIDIGASSSGVGLFFNGNLAHIDYVPIGGAHITSDIARCFSTPIMQAEKLKTLYGSSILSPADGRESVTIPQIGDDDASKAKQVNKSEIVDVIKSRVEEIFEKIKEKIIAHPSHRYVGHRLVLTGGSSMLNGIIDIAETTLDKKARIAKPANINDLVDKIKVPSFANCAGLLKYAQQQKGPYAMLASRRSSSSISLNKLINWLKNG